MVLEQVEEMTESLQSASWVDCRLKLSYLLMMVLPTVLQAHALQKHIQMKWYSGPLSKLVPVFLALFMPIDLLWHALICL